MRFWACIKAWCEDTHYDRTTRGNVTQAAVDAARGKAARTTKPAPTRALTGDQLLDQEFAFISWDDSCQNLYSIDQCCRRLDGHDGEHASGFGPGRVRWAQVPEANSATVRIDPIVNAWMAGYETGLGQLVDLEPDERTQDVLLTQARISLGSARLYAARVEQTLAGETA